MAACVLPHVVRLLGPDVSVRDGLYANAALMMTRGLDPYHDFVQPAFPVAEGILALLVEAFGHDMRVLEVATTIVILGTAWIVRAAARRSWGPLAGNLAAVLWCWSLWVVHFHAFERETWAAAGTAAAILLVSRNAALGWRAAFGVAVALLVAFSLKVTAANVAAGLALHLALTRRAADAGRLLAAFGACALSITAVCAAIWGRDFFVQVYVFGLFREPILSTAGKVATVLAYADPVVLLGLAGAIVMPRHPASAVLVCQLMFVAFVSPTFWDHNMIDFAVPCALLGAGVLVRRELWPRVAVSVAALVVLTVVQPYGWLEGDYGPRGPGLGGQPRRGVERRAEFIVDHTGEDDVVVTIDPWWSFQAGRTEFVRYWDVEPLVRGVKASLEADGLLATMRKTRWPLVIGPGHPETPRRIVQLPRYLRRLMANSLVYVRPRLLEALKRQEIALVLEPLPPRVLREADLIGAGYERFGEGGLLAWRPGG